MIHIGLQLEYVVSLFGLKISNSFLTALIVSLILSVLSLFFYFRKRGYNNIIIKGTKVLVFELLKLIDSVTEDRRLSKKILPLVATFFIFIVSANLLALIPGFLGSFFIKTPAGKFPFLRSPNSDLTITLALAIFSVLSIQFFSWQELGTKRYVKRFFNFSSPINFIVGFFEIISESVKVLSFSFRLFGNMFAGEVLLLIVAFLVPYIIPLPFMILEVFVGIIQAFIFAVLTLTFIKTSTMRHIRSKA